MSKDVLKLALAALETAHAQTCIVGRPKDWWQLSDAITAIKQALEQPVQEPDGCRHIGEQDCLLDVDEKAWRSLVENRGGCRCHISPPCGACSNPISEEELNEVGYTYTTPSAAPVQEPVARCSQCGHKCPQTINQEPIGWWDAKLGFFEEKHFDQLQPLYTTPPAQEIVCSTGLCHYKPAAPVQPVASLKEADVLMIAEAHGIDPSTKGLYGFYIDCISSQPAAQRQWVGLTDRAVGKAIDDVHISSQYGHHHTGFWMDFYRAIESKLKELNT